MAQQDISKLSGNEFKRVLYSKSMLGLTPIAGGSICGDATKYLGRIVEEYTPPTPNYKTAEIKMLGGVSKFHGSGISSYKIDIKIYFKSKAAYVEFLYFTKSELVYYDENGYIYSCSVIGEPNIERTEAGNKYLVKLSLQGVKKDSYYEEFENKFSDIANHKYENDIIEISACGLVALVSDNGYVYSYNPNAVATRAEIVTFLNRLRKYVKSFVS
jgi:hypothetical protein